MTSNPFIDNLKKEIEPYRQQIIGHKVYGVINDVRDLNIFMKYPQQQISEFRKRVFPNENGKKFTVFWNSRNARRKNPGSVIWWFNDFLNVVGKF